MDNIVHPPLLAPTNHTSRTLLFSRISASQNTTPPNWSLLASFPQTANTLVIHLDANHAEFFIPGDCEMYSRQNPTLSIHNHSYPSCNLQGYPRKIRVPDWYGPWSCPSTHRPSIPCKLWRHWRSHSRTPPGLEIQWIHDGFTTHRMCIILIAVMIIYNHILSLWHIMVLHSIAILLLLQLLRLLPRSSLMINILPIISITIMILITMIMVIIT